jgi:hypothetical protein
MDIGTLLLMVAFAYGLGIFWYDLLPGKLPEQTWRIAAYPFVLTVLAETFVPFGPTFGGFHPATAVVAGLVGVIIDWVVTQVRHPSTTPLELQPATATR